MLIRRYPDGAVAFDPTDGRTYSYPLQTFEIIEAIASMIRPGVDTADVLEREALRELGFGNEDHPDAAATDVEHLRPWVELALRLSNR